jgi:2-hydroxychromene-2-carboxylate isomerase
MIVDLFCDLRQFGAPVSLQLDMGEIIYLDEWRADHLRSTPDAAPAFFFDLSDPLSYLRAERVERNFGGAEWIPVSAEMVHRGQPRLSSGAPANEDDASADAVREFAEAQAHALRLPLVWPDRFPEPVPQAQRAAAYAVAIGAGPQFALAASRLAFCGGFDLSDPEILAEAAAASAVPLATCLRAAGDPAWDAPLEATAHSLCLRGIRELPAFRVGRRWFEGGSGLLHAAGGLEQVGGAGAAGRAGRAGRAGPARAGGPLAPVC